MQRHIRDINQSLSISEHIMANDHTAALIATGKNYAPNESIRFLIPNSFSAFAESSNLSKHVSRIYLVYRPQLTPSLFKGPDAHRKQTVPMSRAGLREGIRSPRPAEPTLTGSRQEEKLITTFNYHCYAFAGISLSLCSCSLVSFKRAFSLQYTYSLSV